MTTRIKLRRDTAANWILANPILAAGEPGLETDTGKVKYGDGVTAYASLPHSGGDALTNEGSITVQTGDADRWLVRLRQEDDTYTPSPNRGVVVYNTNYDSEGNVFVLAQVELDSPDSVAVFKFTAAGELVWKTILNTGDNYYNEGSAAVTPDDDIVFCLNQDSPDVIIVKINGSTGAVVFSREVVLGGSYNINSVAVDSNGNIIIAGNDNNGNIERGLVMKLNATAQTIIWQTGTSVDNGDTTFNAVAVDANNNVIVTGNTDVATPEGVNESENVIVVAKFSGLTGQITWQRTVALEEVRYGRSVGLSLDSVGNIYVCGSLFVANPDADTPWDGRNSNAIVVFKMTSQGAMVWDRRVGPGPCDWVGVSTAVGNDGDLYLYAATYQRRANQGVNNNDGNYDSTLVLARYNKTTGAVIWQKYFNNPNAQELTGFDNNGPWAWGLGNTLDVFEDRIVIGGTTRLGPSGPDLWMNQETNRYFTQGFVAQFDTDATKFSVDGWTLETSRIPGKLTNSLVATPGPMEDGSLDKTVGDTLTITTRNTGISVNRRASKINTWTFGKDGTFTAPADTNIKLQQSQLGYANMYGIWNNNEDGIEFQSVTHDADGNAYVLGTDYWTGGFAHIYKFSPEGELLWQRQLYSGSGAVFNVTYANGVYTQVTVSSTGNNYKVGDKIVLNGSNLGGTSGVHELTLTVASLGNSNNGIGEISTVTIVSGVANGTGSANDVSDFYDNAECDIHSMTFDPVTGNPVVVISVPTYNGDTLDSEWTETVALLIDSGSGAVLSTTTLSGTGDIYPNDVAVSSTGKVAIVGQKYGEYTEYGAITPLGDTATDKLWVAKSDIDAEHYPGEPNGNISDWWITGTGITDQAQVQSVNNYQGLTGTTRQGSGAVFDIINNNNGTYSVGIVNGGTNYRAGHKIKILGTSLNGTTPGNDITITVDAVDAGVITGVSNTGTAAYGSSNTLNTTQPTDYSYWQFNTGTGLTEIGNPQGSLLTALQSGIPSGASGGALGGIFLLTSAFTYDPMAGGGAGAWTASFLSNPSAPLPGGGTNSATSVSITYNSPVPTVTGISGTNHQVGSGAEFNYWFDPATGNIYNSGFTNAGQNYVVGDVITISGTQFAGGATPANDITVTVTSVGGSGELQNPVNFAGTPALTHLLITTNASVDYVAPGGSFAIKQALGGETFIWTPDWSRTMGQGGTDEYFDGVVWNAAGTSLYAVGSGRYETNYDQALVTKWSSSGTLQGSVSVNDNQNSDGASHGSVALMANDSIVTVHTMYNNERDETDEILVTKLDGNLQIVWQQFIGIWSDDDGWTGPDSQPSVAVDPATDEILVTWEATEQDVINDDAIFVVKLDTDGDVVWKRVFGIHESDTNLLDNSKNISISGNKFTIVGSTDGPNDNTVNAMIFTMPLDGTGLGQHGLWWYFEPNDDQVKVMKVDRESNAFTPNVNNNTITGTDNVKYYYTSYPEEEFDLFRQVIRSESGGAIEFADGSKQSFSTAIVPQVKISAGRYTVRAEDSGRHILVETTNYDIIIPNYREVTLPVGFTFTVVNIAGNDAYIETQFVDNGQRGSLWISGGNNKTPRIGFDDDGSGQMITLMKIKEGTTSDDGEQHGDIWMVAGANIFNAD